MKFKVWDKVRLTREAIADNANIRFSPEEILWWEVEAIEDHKWEYCFVWQAPIRLESELELVPEKPEFEYGEEIEVSDDGEEWEKRVYLATVGAERKLHICVSRASIERYKSWLVYNAYTWEYARKLKPQLTRKEIAEKFWVSENFILVD